MAATIYYDGECPFCSQYMALVRVREAIGPLHLVDVRNDEIARKALEAAGCLLDDGIVLDLHGQTYVGSEAMHQLSLLGSNRGLFNKFTSAIFGTTLVARLVYPILRVGRCFTLFALGRQRIAVSSREDLAQFALFSHAWGMCAFLHLLYVVYYSGGESVLWTVWASGALGTYLAVRPGSPRIFVVLSVFMLFDAWAQMPGYSNHTFLRNLTLLGILLALVYNGVRNRSWSCFMNSFAPVGRSLLTIMYVFGVFHKLNADFLNPEVSCATALWDSMPEPFRQLDFAWFRWSAIYGTLIGESAILLGLLFRPTRRAAIFVGTAFHAMLALAGYSFYLTFSTLAITLHLLFVSPDAAFRISNSSECRALKVFLRGGRGIAALMLWLGAMWLITMSGNSSSVGLIWLPWALGVIYLIYKHGSHEGDERTVRSLLMSRSLLLNVVSAFFLLNCYAPYLGLKTAQAMSMYSNLSVEGGESNHILIRKTHGLFNYADDTVRPISAGSTGTLAYAVSNGLHVTYYDLLNSLERDRSAVVSYERGGVVHTGQSYDSLQTDIDRLLHTRLLRSWILFRPVDMTSPKACSVS